MSTLIFCNHRMISLQFQAAGFELDKEEREKVLRSFQERAKYLSAEVEKANVLRRKKVYETTLQEIQAHELNYEKVTHFSLLRYLSCI